MSVSRFWPKRDDMAVLRRKPRIRERAEARLRIAADRARPIVLRFVTLTLPFYKIASILDTLPVF